MAVTGAELVACARSWLGTRFHHQGRLKKTARHSGGVDCLGLLVGVAAELGLRGKQGQLFSDADVVSYGHLPDVAKLRQTLAGLMDEVAYIGLGDVLLMEIDGRAQHLGLSSEVEGMPAIIHAYAPAKAVVEHVLDAWWRQRVVAIFRVV